MEEIKRRFIDSVDAKLSAAPRSTAKDELVEELSDNLYRRFLDMTSAGMSDEAAFTRSMEDLGDVDELLSYLGVEPNGDAAIREECEAAQEDADDAQEEADDAQDEADDAQDEADAAQERADAAQGTEAADAAQAEADAAQERADAAQREADAAQARADAAQARADAAKKQAEGGGRHDNYGQFPQSDLNAILAGVSEVCNTAIDQAKTALKQARDAIQRRTTWEKEKSRVTVHFNTHPDTSKAPETPETPEPPEAPASEMPDPPETPETPEPTKGWEFEAELDTDAGRFFAGGGPKEKKDVVYGFGYDKTKGGFFAQWGEYQADGPEGKGPHFSGEGGSYMEHQDDGSYSVTALRDLRGIEVFTMSGDVSIHVSEAPDAGVIIDGDVDELDVTCSADGVLTIREGRTASSSFFSRRGFCSADVELFLPRRHWELITVHTASGDVDIDRDGLDVGQLSVKTASGDLNAHLRACAQLHFASASGDIDLDLEGRCTELRAETMSGDINLRGLVENAFLKSASGDIELEGLAKQFLAGAVSGDVRLKTAVLPLTMELSSKSGGVEACLPDEGPFSVRTKTVSGGMRCDFPVHHTDGAVVYGDGSGPVYSMTTVSGDVSLRRR